MDHQGLAFSVMLVGGLTALTVMLGTAMGRLRLPPLVGFILLGFLVRLGDAELHFLPDRLRGLLPLLGGIGVIALLFRVGLESDLRQLVRQLRNASVIWVCNVVLTAATAWLAMRHLLGADILASMFVAVALSATSIGVSVGVWSDAGAMRSRHAAVLLDAAELDDLSSVALMALLLAVAPHVAGAGDAWPWDVVAVSGWRFLWMFGLFAAGCWLLALVAERAFSNGLSRLLGRTEITVLATGLAVAVAGIADLLGFSLAVGALFAGLALSRHRARIADDHAQRTVHELFVPFFFIGIGFAVDPAVVGDGLAVGLPLLLLAAAAKFAGTAVPALLAMRAKGAVLLGVSMVPRAEIAMVVAQYGLEAGYLPPRLYAAMVVVSLGSCLVAPTVLHALMRRWPEAVRGGGE